MSDSLITKRAIAEALKQVCKRNHLIRYPYQILRQYVV